MPQPEQQSTKSFAVSAATTSTNYDTVVGNDNKNKSNVLGDEFMNGYDTGWLFKLKHLI